MSAECPDCGAPFASNADLVAHMQTSHGGGDSSASLAMNPESEIPGLECALCGARFSRPTDLASHNLNAH